MDDRDLPEGVIDADPPGAWESAEAADGETAEQSQDAEGSDRLTDSGFPSTASDGNGPAAPSGPVESDEATQGADPDLSADEED